LWLSRSHSGAGMQPKSRSQSAGCRARLGNLCKCRGNYEINKITINSIWPVSLKRLNSLQKYKKWN
jgi:hypothetical protein